MSITITPDQSTSREYGSAGTMTITTTPTVAGVSVLNTSNQGLSLSASEGTAPYSWEIVSGRIAPGLVFSAQGSFTGHPTGRGTALFSVRVTDSATPIPNFADADMTVS
jgi:hypothetical protein